MNDIKGFSINKKRQTWPKVIAGLVILLLFVFILNAFISPVRNYFLTISSPVRQVLWTAGESSSGFLGSVSSFFYLNDENERLRKENENLIYKMAILQSIQQANRAQSDVSLSCQNNDFQLVIAGVTGLDKDILSINKGAEDGIKEEMPVINQQNIVVGKILKVYKNFSDIILISNKNSLLNVKIQDIAPQITIDESSEEKIVEEISETNGVVKGLGNLTARLELVPVNSELEIDDILVTSSLDKNFPKDLLVGKITKIAKNDQEPFQQAQINLFFDIQKVDNLFVITNYK